MYDFFRFFLSTWLVHVHGICTESPRAQDMFPTLIVAGILRQRYPECRAASKVFNNPLSKMIL
jgi:hypothetical protein